MRAVLIVILQFVVELAYSQLPVIQWEKTYGGSDEDRFNSICIKNDTTYFFIGSTESSGGYITNNHGTEDVWIVKTDQMGSLLWNKCYGGISGERGNDMVYSSQEELVLAAEASYNSIDVMGVHNYSEDFWILKIDSIGNIIWKNCFGGSQNEYVASLIETFDGGYLVTGQAGSNDYDIYGNHGSDDVWVLKLDSMGLIQWSKPLGSSGYDFARGNRTCIQLLDSSYLIVGSIHYNDGNVSGSHGGGDMWVVKLDETGQLLWQKCYGGSSLDNGYGIVASGNNGFYANG